MFITGEKKFSIYDMFVIIILLLSITQIIISAILRNKVNSELEHYKYTIKKIEDIPISTVESIIFAKNKSKPEYNPNTPNLGLAGDLILDCYRGYCTEEITETRSEYRCYDEDDCDYEPYEYTYKEDKLDYRCSFDCFINKGNECNKCYYSSKYISSKGRCSFKTHDEYNKEKYCISSNIIYFWKGEKYESIERGYNYLENAILKNEECPMLSKNCGIIDDNENKLCIPYRLNCPINIISEEKINNNNSSFNIGNKTYYYYFDENAKKKKLIYGLFVDTDINKKEEEDYYLLDTYTISGLLEDNKILYKGENLGFDPYSEKDIDKKGKSYLKVKYNKNVDLISLREKNNTYFKKKRIQDNFISPVTNKFNSNNILGIIGYSALIFIILIFMLISFCSKSTKEDYIKIANHHFGFLCCFVPTSICFIIITIFPTIKYCKIDSKLNEIDKDINISSIKICNKIFIILSFIIYGIIFLFIVVVCIYRKKSLDLLNKQIEKNNNTNTTFAAVATDSNINQKI